MHYKLYNRWVQVLYTAYMNYDMYGFHRYLNQYNMVCQDVFRNDVHRLDKHNRFYMINMMCHLMKYNWDRIHDMEDIEMFSPKENIQANKTKHTNVFVNTGIHFVCHKFYIDSLENRCMLNISNDILDN